jgi:hypothetical protein
MILKERGQVDLDGPINDYLGEVQIKARVGNAAEATVHRVATHLGGLPGHFQFFYADEPANCPSMEETIRRYAQIVIPPGERFSYSNLGYGILGYLIERISGLSYSDFLRRELFLPLGMYHTSMEVEPALEPFRATLYGADGLRFPWYAVNTPGASSAFGSAHDLVRFGMFHLQEHLPDQKAIISNAALDEMPEMAISYASGRGYGLGWWTNADIYGYSTISHAGSLDGVSASLWLIPSERLVVAALANIESEIIFQIVDDIFEHLLPPYAAGLASERAAAQTVPLTTAPTTPDFVPPSELVGEWRGIIQTMERDIPFHLWFKDNGDVHIQVGNQLKTLVNDIQMAHHQLKGRMLGTITTPEANCRPQHLRLDLTLRGDVLHGVVMTVPSQEGAAGAAPTRRSGSALSYWVEVRKSKGN